MSWSKEREPEELQKGCRRLGQAAGKTLPGQLEHPARTVHHLAGGDRGGDAGGHKFAVIASTLPPPLEHKTKVAES